jgi:8-oxo-dGTP pyrophosphatase MutT (NUDIX family)
MPRPGSDLSNVSRAALILYTKEDGKTFALLGKNANGLTSLGGRSNTRETWIDCLVRELKEETRGILDYSECKKMLQIQPGRTVITDNCAYVFYPVPMSVLRETSEKFPLTSSPNPHCNEMSSLEIVEIDSLIEDIIMHETTETESHILCNPTFKAMFMNIGYDVLKGNICNFFTENVGIEFELSCRISDLPHTICLTPINDRLPIVYGYSKSKSLFITEQFYLEQGGRKLFRSGWHHCD